jgi:5,10-methylenetetrahydromethanopterin reductase
LVTDRHVDALTLSGTITEVTDHVVALLGAGIDGIIISPFAPKGGTIEDTIVSFGSTAWPQAISAFGQSFRSA